MSKVQPPTEYRPFRFMGMEVERKLSIGNIITIATATLAVIAGLIGAQKDIGENRKEILRNKVESDLRMDKYEKMQERLSEAQVKSSESLAVLTVIVADIKAKHDRENTRGGE